MKALTICQPYAHLICLPEADPRHKRVENRTWATRYRGPIAIHAGKSRSWLDLSADKSIDEEYDIRVADMAFGAVVATANLVACLNIEAIVHGRYPDKYRWLATHNHTEGPWCWVLADVKAIEPIPYTGAQGLWDFPEELILGASAQAREE